MKRILSILIIFPLLISAVFLLPVRAEEGTEARAQYYGRDALSTLDNSTALLYAYDAISTGVEQSLVKITVYNGTDKLSQDELRTVIDAYRRDRVDHFWFGTQYTVSYNKKVGTNEIDTVVSITPTYLFKGDALNLARELISIRAGEILSGIPEGASDYEKLVYIHDSLAASVEYYEGDNAHNLYGALVLGKTVCEGYAEALQYLLYLSGIEGFLAIGESVNSASGLVEGHEWNYVKIDGKWAHYDLTWNDQSDNLFHAYFGLSDEKIALDHVVDDVAYALPECTSDELNYFNVYGGALTAPYSVSAVCATLSAGNKRGSFYVDSVSDFTLWLKNNAAEIATELGVTTSFTYGYSVLGNEVRFHIDDCKHTDSIEYVAPVGAGCVSDGNIEHYRCTLCGKLFSDQLGANLIDRESVVIEPLGHDYSVVSEEDEFIRTKGNCKVKDIYWYACKNCGHSAGENPLASDKYYTGTTFGEHRLDEWGALNGEHWQKCSVPTCIYQGEKSDCHGGAPTCSRQAVCEDCGFGYGETLPHNFDTTAYGYKKANGHAHICIDCSAPDVVAPHRSAPGSVATEENPVLCETCDYIMTPALGHGENHTPREEWTRDEWGHWYECVGCEGKQLSYSLHIDEDEDGKCDACTYSIPEKEDPDPITDVIPEIVKMLDRWHIILIFIGCLVVIIGGFGLKIYLKIRKRM